MLFQYSAKTTTITLVPLSLAGLAKIGLNVPAGHIVAGFGEDEFLTIEMADDDITTTTGADGFVVRSSLPNKIANGVLTLQQTSPTNLILEAYQKADKLLFGAGLFKFSVKVPTFKTGVLPSGFGTGDTCTATAYVTKMADIKFGKESGERAWAITLVDPQFKSTGGAIGAVLGTLGIIGDTIQDGFDIVLG